MDIQTLKIVGESVTGGGANCIVPLDENGMTGDSICWWTTEDGCDEDCWFDGDNWEKITGVTIKEGQGFYIYAEDVGLKIQSSGAVKLTDYAVQLGQGYNLVGNASPVDIDLQQLTLSGSSVTGGGANCIVPLDENGMTGDSICWWTTEDGCDEDCWFDGDNWEKITGVTIKAGKGLYLYCEDTGLTLNFPSAVGAE